MKAVVQRVLNANVVVDGEIISSIDRGLCVLVGISREDNNKDIDYMVRKILNLRFFDNDEGQRWKCSVMQKNYQILCISQFTLHYSLKGNKLDFHRAMPAESSEPFYCEFLQSLRSAYKMDAIKDGKFGAMMTVNIVNDGPVTIQLDSDTSAKAKDNKNEHASDSSIDGATEMTAV